MLSSSSPDRILPVEPSSFGPLLVDISPEALVGFELVSSFLLSLPTGLNITVTAIIAAAITSVTAIITGFLFIIVSLPTSYRSYLPNRL